MGSTLIPLRAREPDWLKERHMVCAMEVPIKLRHQEIVFSDHHPKEPRIVQFLPF